MPESAKVSSLDALKQFKETLAKFGEQAQQALSTAQGDIQRAMNRLQNEQMAYWKQKEKHWHRKLQEAKTELARAELQPRDERPSAVIERKAVEKAQRHVQRAQEKQQKIKHWVRVLEREAMMCKGQLQHLSQMLDADLPNTQALVERMLMELEQYVKTPAATERRSEAPQGDERTASMARSVAETPAGETQAPPAEPPEIDEPDAEARQRAEPLEPLPAVPESALLAEPNRERLDRLAGDRDLPEQTQRVIIEPNAVAASSLILLRMEEPPAGDSGWFLAARDRTGARAGNIRATTLGALLESRTDLDAALRLPPGTMIVIDDGRVSGVYDTREDDGD